MALAFSSAEPNSASAILFLYDMPRMNDRAFSARKMIAMNSKIISNVSIVKHPLENYSLPHF